MDRLPYFFVEKPAALLVVMLGLFVGGAMLLVILVEQGQRSFNDRAQQMFQSPAASNTQSDSSDSAPTAQRPAPTQSAPAVLDQSSSESDSEFTKPLKISSVRMIGAKAVCGDSQTDVTINGMLLVANSEHRDQRFAWKVDILGNLNYSTQDEWIGRVPAGEVRYEVAYEGTDAEVLYSRSFSHPHEEIRLRLHVTSPNDVTSNWLTVPASSRC